jgi:hypothetical protein
MHREKLGSSFDGREIVGNLLKPMFLQNGSLEHVRT